MPANNPLIRRAVISRRSPVYQEQSEFLARLIDELEVALIQHFGVDSTSRIRPDQIEDLWEMLEYTRFVRGAYACGFVCTDFKPEYPFENPNVSPEKKIGVCDFRTLRHYVHALLRDEKWADGFSSPILESLISGALQIVSQRLKSDDSLYEPW